MYKSPALMAVLAITAAALAGCSSGSLEDAAPAPEVIPTTQTASPAADPSTLTPEAPAEPETAAPSLEPSPEPTRHWLAPPPAPAEAAVDPEAWADYKYTEWLHGMNTTYREMCGELTDLSVYRDCVPDDPHAYITDFSATEVGELVITIGDGPWENGAYDTDAIPAAHFVAGNAPFHIAKFATDFDSITAVTPDGDSYTEDYEPYLDTYFDGVELEDQTAD